MTSYNLFTKLSFFRSLLQDRMRDTKKKNELVRSEMDNGLLNSTTNGKPSQDAADDAGALAAFMRERKEDLALTKTNDDKVIKTDEANAGKQYRNLYKDKKVVRRKITKTHADGTQTTTFKFIINDDETLMLASKKDTMKKRGVGILDFKKKSNNTNNLVLGHSIFEDDISSIKLIQKRRPNRGRGGRRIDGDYVPKGKGSSQSRVKGKQDKRRQKRKREEDDEDIYLRRGTNNRKARGSARELKPHAKFAESLEDIRSTVEKRPSSGPFHRPVDR